MRLREYLIKRMIQILITLIVVLVMLFVVFRMMPGDPAAMVMSPKFTPEQRELLRHQYGLDKPMWEQFALYMKNMLVFDMGTSFYYSQPVLNIISIKLGPTLLLFGTAMIIAYVP